ncbi:pilus assembly protein (FilC) [Oleiphilus messinensis]|uniref:Pilus assembly protein (FilC) n=1 Tax=Oleiphilus messinensis TaxID=141451 RepID=A0A1Y0I793_9GAMM|nr:flagellar protein FilC [Oleiphilus messinensis]ARU56311.1 pilus assembly protein (FilC) [Oleiphilus messinensis]
MNRWVVPCIVFCSSTLVFTPTWAEEPTSVDKAREALTKQEGDTDSAQQLEEVFQAAEKNYSLIKKGNISLSFSSDYSYFGDQRLDIQIVNSSVRNLNIVPSATHTFTNSFSVDYGLLSNVTVGARIPLVVKYDTQKEVDTMNMGDVSLSLKWQPLEYTPGKISSTVFTSLGTKTGVSPYEIDTNNDLSTGSGNYSLSTGLSLSKVLDPVVVYGSSSVSYGMPITGLNQVRGGRLLTKVSPGFSASFSGGFSYSLSYDISLSASIQMSYSDETTLTFSDGTQAVSQDQISSVMNFSLGTRVSEKTIVNTNVGFGLTEDSPDVILGFSLPINIAGLKEQ